MQDWNNVLCVKGCFKKKACELLSLSQCICCGFGFQKKHALSVWREQPSISTGETLEYVWKSRTVRNTLVFYWVPIHGCCSRGICQALLGNLPTFLTIPVPLVPSPPTIAPGQLFLLQLFCRWPAHCFALEDHHVDAGLPLMSTHTWVAGSGWPLRSGAGEKVSEHDWYHGEHHPLLHPWTLIISCWGTGGCGVQPVFLVQSGKSTNYRGHICCPYLGSTP